MLQNTETHILPCVTTQWAVWGRGKPRKLQRICKASNSRADVQECTATIISEDLGSTPIYFCTPFGLMILFLGIYPNKTLHCVPGCLWSHLNSKALETLNASTGMWGHKLWYIYIMGYYVADKWERSIYIYFLQRSLKHRIKKSTVDSGDNDVSM